MVPDWLSGPVTSTSAPLVDHEPSCTAPRAWKVSCGRLRTRLTAPPELETPLNSTEGPRSSSTRSNSTESHAAAVPGAGTPSIM